MLTYVFGLLSLVLVGIAMVYAYNQHWGSAAFSVAAAALAGYGAWHRWKKLP